MGEGLRVRRFDLRAKCRRDFLSEAEDGGYATEAGVARRLLGATCLLQGDLAEARIHLERTVADHAPDRDGEARFRFGIDTRAGALAYLALTSWHLGEVERARLSIEQAIRLGAELGHPTTLAHAHYYKAIVEARREDAAAALGAAEVVVDISRERGLEFYLAAGQALSGWARARLSQAKSAEFDLALTNYMRLGNKFGAPGFKGLLAELEAQPQNMDDALARIGEGLAVAEETGERYTNSLLHRIRGDILLRRDPANPAPAEDAYRTAIAIAKHQGARSYELLASLSLAKLCQSTSRPADAQAVLAPALEGFAPTAEMPEIAEAQALLAVLAQTEQVKAEASQRQRRMRLQTSYGQVGAVVERLRRRGNEGRVRPRRGTGDDNREFFGRVRRPPWSVDPFPRARGAAKGARTGLRFLARSRERGARHGGRRRSSQSRLHVLLGRRFS
jgi:predicted ATPase